MCWCFPFGLSNSKKRNSSSGGEKKRRDKPAGNALHGTGVAVVEEVQEKRRPRDSHPKKKSRESVGTRSPHKERDDQRSRQQYQYYDDYRRREQYRPALNVQVPNMWYRSVDEESTNSSQEMLLNPRPHRSQHHRQRHPKRTSQTTLRGRGAKRDPPRGSKSKKNLRGDNSRQSVGWSLFHPSPPKTPSRRDYTRTQDSPRSHRSSRHNQSSSSTYYSPAESSSTSQRHRSSRQHTRQPPSSRQARSRTPNTAARRTPDRRFAVLAATNQALEDLRREAFAQPSPPPRRERTQRYQGVTVPTSTIPFNWDCVSSSQTSGGYAEGSGGGRRRRSRR